MGDASELRKWYSNEGLVHSLEHLFDPLEHAEELVDETDVLSVLVNGQTYEPESPKRAGTKSGPVPSTVTHPHRPRSREKPEQTQTTNTTSATTATAKAEAVSAEDGKKRKSTTTRHETWLARGSRHDCSHTDKDATTRT